MKIGIGITTFRRPEVLKATMRQWDTHLPDCDNVTFVQQDTEPPKGIAFQKNVCLRKLLECRCDYIFLFDDDIYPKVKKWYQPFIEATKHGINHLTYTFHDGISVKEGYYEGYPYFNTPKGPLMFFTRECIDTVGGFDERFGVYGGEHLEMSSRIHRMGLNPKYAMSLPNIKELFYAMDFEYGVNSALTHNEKIAGMTQSNSILGQLLNSEPQKIPL